MTQIKKSNPDASAGSSSGESPDANFNWDASAFFRRLTESNKFAALHGYRFCEVSGLDGFHAALGQALSSKAFVCVNDTSAGATDINNTPHTRRVKTVFLAFRHKAGDEKARNAAMDNMRELFRQFMSVLIQEKTKLDENCIYIDSRISFTEIKKYFFTGCACAYFQIAVDTYTDLTYNPEEWTLPPINP